MQNSRSFLRFLLLGGLLGTVACGDAPEASLQGSGTASAPLTDGGECNLEGTWAIKFVIPVTWSSNIGVQGGKGEIIQWARTERHREDSFTVVDALVPCGSIVPDYKSQPIFHGETYGTRFPDSLFDGGTLRPTQVRTHVANFALGGQFQSGFAPIQLGVAMNDPLNDAWPSKGSALQSQQDGEGDGHPGVTLVADTSPGYSLPPTNMFGTKRAAKFYVAIRNVASTSGVIEHCDKLSAKAEIPVIGGKAAINSHVLGCQRADGTECSQAEADMLDRFQPQYIPSNATATMVRVDSNATCKEIRGLTF